MSLPELLVAMACAALVAFMAFELLRGENGHNTRTRAKIRVQSDVREAMQVIEDDVLNAGFRTGTAVSGTFSGIAATPAAPFQISLSLDPASSPALRVGDGTVADTLEFRFFSLAPGGYPDSTMLNVVTYTMDVDSNLVRSFYQINTGTMTSGAVSVSRILPHIITFQAQIGTDSSVDEIGRGASDTISSRVGAGFDFSTALAGASASATTTPALSDTFTLKNWVPAKLAGFDGPLKTFEPRSTYRLSLNLQPNANFLMWMDTVPAKRPTNFIRLGLMDKNGNWIPGDSVRVWYLPWADHPTRIDWTFRTGAAAVDAHLALRAQLDPTTVPASIPALGIANLRLVRKRNANQSLVVENSPNPNWIWHNGDSGAVALRRQTLGVRFWVLARSAKANKEGSQPTFTGIGNWQPGGYTPASTDKNTYVLQERVVPMVNR